MSFKTAARVRNCTLSHLKSDLEFDGQKLLFKHPKDGKLLQANFDHCFWSSDGFSTNEQGYHYPTEDRYADQTKVYSTLGVEMVNNVFNGEDATFITYGGTASGQFYTAVGRGSNRGLLPNCVEEVLRKINEEKSSNIVFKLYLSAYEIYCEKIIDLLDPQSKLSKNGLKLREEGGSTVVEGLKEVEITSLQDFNKYLEESRKNAISGKNMMNSETRRGHSIYVVKLEKSQREDNETKTTSSQMTFAVLTGPEKIAKSGGVQGDALKEITTINKSLGAFINVLTKLKEKAKGKPNVTVPYRESLLTRVLKNSFEGWCNIIVMFTFGHFGPEDIQSTIAVANITDKLRTQKPQQQSIQSEPQEEEKEDNEENTEINKVLEELAEDGSKEKSKPSDDVID